MCPGEDERTVAAEVPVNRSAVTATAARARTRAASRRPRAARRERRERGQEGRRRPPRGLRSARARGIRRDSHRLTVVATTWPQDGSARAAGGVFGMGVDRTCSATPGMTDTAGPAPDPPARVPAGAELAAASAPPGSPMVGAGSAAPVDLIASQACPSTVWDSRAQDLSGYQPIWTIASDPLRNAVADQHQPVSRADTTTLLR